MLDEKRKRLIQRINRSFEEDGPRESGMDAGTEIGLTLKGRAVLHAVDSGLMRLNNKKDGKRFEDFWQRFEEDIAKEKTKWYAVVNHESRKSKKWQRNFRIALVFDALFAVPWVAAVIMSLLT